MPDVPEERTETEEDTEHFIPFLRDDVIELCLEDGRLEGREADDFRAICAHLVDYLHCRFLTTSDSVKRHYAPFDPDRETILPERDPRSLENSETELVDLFRQLAEDANFFPVDHATIEQSFERETLIKLRTQVDLDEFDQVLCYARGDLYQEVPVPRLFRKRVEEVDILQRVLLFLKLKDEAWFKEHGRKHDTRMKPGKIYLYFYKDVPKWDLELLFPNVRVGMRLKDKLMFGIPAIGGGIGVIAKILPQVVVLSGVILFFLGARSWAEGLGINEDSATRAMPVLTALLGVTMALGGLAVKQWNSYQRKRIKFLRDVTEQLFFRNLATNRSVFHRVIDSAEEEEGKEMIILLYHLFSSRSAAQTPADLDHSIECWMRDRFGTAVDFDIDDALQNLKRLRATVPDGRTLTLLTEDADRGLHVPSPRDARALLDALAADRFGL